MESVITPGRELGGDSTLIFFFFFRSSSEAGNTEFDSHFGLTIKPILNALRHLFTSIGI